MRPTSRLPARLAAALLVLLVALPGCTYDLFDEDQPEYARFDIEDVLGTYVGERTLTVDGQPVRTEATTATVTHDGSFGYGTVDIAIDTGGRVSTFSGSYSEGGIYITGYGGGTQLDLNVDAEGFVTGSLTVGGETRVYTGRLTRDAFDLFERAPDGSFRDDVRTTRR